MKIEQAIEMVEALTLDNEHGIDSLNKHGDEVALALYKRNKELEGECKRLWALLDDISTAVKR